jgi:nitrite reductase/ring-hydroxylating ferredoxin subunit
MVLLILQLKTIPVKKGLKIVFFLFPVVLLTPMISCTKAKNDVIPDVYVNFTLDIFDPEFVNLTSIGSDTVDARTNNWGSGAAGFDGNGIIIYNGGEAFYAYDRTCPHDYEVNGLSVKVNIDFITIAVCPKCGTTYSLSASGTPASGVGRYPLKNYMTSFDGRYLRVWNN